MSNFRNEFWDKLSSIKIPSNTPRQEQLKILHDISNILQPHLPTSIFKYRVCNTRNIDALSRNVIYAVPASYMNDPFDCLVYVDKEYITNSIKYALSKDFIENIRRENKFPDNIDYFISQELAQELLSCFNNLSEEQIDEITKHNESARDDLLRNIDIFIDESIKTLQKQSLISSFGDNPCDASMWTYYAEEHKGYALEYKVTSSTFDFCAMCQNADTENCDGTQVRARLYPMVYSEKRYNATDWVDSRIGTTSLEAVFGETNDYYPDILTFDKSCLIKGKQWAHENEWRVVCYPVHTPKTSAPIAVHTHTPSAIYYGAKIADEDYRILHNTIETLRGSGAKIAEYRMVIDSDSDDFSMKTKLISDK